MFISPPGIRAVYHNHYNRITLNKFYYSSQTCHYIVNTIPTLTQIRTGICEEMSRQLQSGGPLERRSTISVSCRPSTLFSGKIFKEPQLQFTTPAQRYEGAAATANTCINNNNMMRDRRAYSMTDWLVKTNMTDNTSISTSLLDILNLDITTTLTSTKATTPITIHNTNTPTATTSHEYMDTSTSTNYYQTRNARRALSKNTTHNLDNCTTHTTPHNNTGNMDNEPDILQQYLASRNNLNNNMHQNIACSFDPSNKTCVTCSTPHNILTAKNNAPIIFTLSDQSFPGKLGGGGGRAVRQKLKD